MERERVRYHEVIRPLKEVAKYIGERLLLYFPDEPKNIVDRGKTAEEARAVQLVLEGMQEYHPGQQVIPDEVEGFDSNGDFHARNRWDDMGNYHDEQS